MKDTVITQISALGLYVFIAVDGTYYARWTNGSTHGHTSATGALLRALELL
jgi:hypothetical protein